MRILLVVLLFALSMPLSAQAAKRLGLVIGNNAYSQVPALEKARGDADAMSKELGALGFEVITVLDATRREMNASIASFTSQLEPGDTALIFYAGHGVEIDGENYLLPTDIATPTASGEDFVKYESIALSDMLDRVRRTGAKTTLVFLDACRDNPFTATAGRSIGGKRGLGRIAAPEGTFVVFSAGANQQALDRLVGDDNNANSVFTRLLLPKLREPGLELRNMVAELRVEVRDLAREQNHEQFPAYYDELLGDFYFTVNVQINPTPETLPAVDVTPGSGASQIRQDFELARSLNSKLAYEVFLDKYAESDDLTVALATQLLEELSQGKPDEVAIVAPPVDIPASPPVEEPAPSRDTGAEIRKERVRQSQLRLTELGCEAGGADGVAGPRTHAAFKRFVASTGADLSSSDLGTERALAVLNSKSGTVCEAPTRVVIEENPTEQQRPTSLAGRWHVTANCFLVINATGTLQLTQTGPNRYRSVIRNSEGQRGVGNLFENNGTLSGTTKWDHGPVETITSQVSADRKSLTGTSSFGCSVKSTKTG